MGDGTDRPDAAAALERTERALARARGTARRLRRQLGASERLASERLERLETINLHTGIGLAELDETLRYRHVNDVLAAINGLPAEAHVGRTIPDVIDSEDGRATERIARDVLESGQASTDTDIRLATAGTAGVVRDWSVSFHPVRRDGEDRACGVDIVVRDVTSRRRSDRCNRLERDIALRLANARGDPEAALGDVLTRLAETFAARLAALWLDDAEGRPVRRAFHREGNDAAAAVARREAALERFAFARDGAAAPATPEWFEDVTRAPEAADAAAAFESGGVGTAFRLAVHDGRTHLGTLALLSRERLGDDPAARAMLERLGRTLAAFVRRVDDERRLRRRERDLDALTRDIPDGLLRLDRTRRIVFVNAAAAALREDDGAAPIGRTASEAGLPRELLEPLDDAFAGRRPPAREFALARAAQHRWYRARYVAEHDEEGDVANVIVIVGDITERRRIAAALAERERGLERALDEVDTLYRNLPVGLCVIDRQRRVTRLNARLGQLLGHRDAPPERLALGRLHPVFADMIAAPLDEVLAHGESVLGHELDGALGEGGERRHWIVDLLPLRDAVGGGTRAVSCSVQDITARKLTEQRLAARAAVAEVLGAARDLERAMPTLLDALGRVFDADIAEYWTRGPNPETLTCKTFRCSERLGDPEATRRYFDERVFVPGEGLPGIVWSERHARRVSDPRHDRRLARGDESRELGLRTALGLPILIDGEPSGVLTLFTRERLATDAMLLETLEQIGRDIGELERRLRDERALEQARLAAEQANRSKSDFLANVSHELRSPLTAILGYADLLEARLADPEDRHSVATVRSNGQHLLALLNDILDLAKIESGKFEPEHEEVSPAALVEEVRALMAVRARERALALDVRFDGALPERIVTDPLRLRQILINLVGNAIKFTDVGSVTLAVRAEDEPESRLVVDVVDTGIGMTRAQCERLFEPFTQVDSSNTRRYGGTGLGLAISRRLSRLLDGELDVASRPGVGTTFTLTLPADVAPGASWTVPDPDELAADEDDAAPTDPPALDARVLVADDRPDIRVMVRRLLEDAGARVVAVADGEAVIDALAAGGASSTLPDAVVMDMQMPRLDGYRTTRRLRANGFDRPIVALTAAAMKGERERCLQAGCDDYLSKPIDGRLLVSTVAALLERARASPPGGAAGSAPRPAGDTADGHGPARVLLVDDNDDAATVTARLLTRSGHEVRTAADGASAIAVSDAWHPDAVLLDLGLPDIDGDEVARRLRAAHGDAITLVALSGRTPAGAGTADSPFDRHLLKPARLRALNELLATVPRRPPPIRADEPG